MKCRSSPGVIDWRSREFSYQRRRFVARNGFANGRAGESVDMLSRWYLADERRFALSLGLQSTGWHPSFECCPGIANQRLKLLPVSPLETLIDLSEYPSSLGIFIPASSCLT